MYNQVAFPARIRHRTERGGAAGHTSAWPRTPEEGLGPVLLAECWVWPPERKYLSYKLKNKIIIKNIAGDLQNIATKPSNTIHSITFHVLFKSTPEFVLVNFQSLIFSDLDLYRHSFQGSLQSPFQLLVSPCPMFYAAPFSQHTYHACCTSTSIAVPSPCVHSCPSPPWPSTLLTSRPLSHSQGLLHVHYLPLLLFLLSTFALESTNTSFARVS